MSSTAKNWPFPRLATAISLLSTTNRRASPSGMSDVWATSNSIVQRPSSVQLGGDGHLEAGPNLRERDAVQDLLEEAEHDEALGFRVRDAPALQVIQDVLVHGTYAGRVP